MTVDAVNTAVSSATVKKKVDVLRIDGIYYDTNKLSEIHPGGPFMLQMCNQRESTAIFYSYHRRKFPHCKYEEFQVKEEDIEESVLLPKQTLPNFDLFFELCEKIKPIIAPTNGFAPWYYYLKALLWVGLMLSLDVYALFAWRPLYLTLLQSFAMAMVGLNVQHDCNHGAISKDWRINRTLGLTQDLLGGSSISWILNHDYIHHVYTNEVGKDDDLDIPLLRLHHKIPLQAMHALQNIYVFVLEALFGPIHVASNIIFIWSTPDSRFHNVLDQWKVSRCMTFIVPIRLLFNFIYAPSIKMWLFVSFLQYAVGGMYLAYFFLISHNFAGAEKKHTSDGNCFVKCQTETSSNFGGAVWAQINGGLNFQIEHHLFPRVHHGYYAAIAPIVREACKKHNIVYTHFETLWDNVRSSYEHLGIMGAQQNIKKL